MRSELPWVQVVRLFYAESVIANPFSVGNNPFGVGQVPFTTLFGG